MITRSGNQAQRSEPRKGYLNCRPGRIIWRSPLSPGILLLAFLAFWTIPAFSQDPPDVAMGTNPQATYHGGDFDIVDMSTGRLNLHIPLFLDHSQRGKLNFTYALTYSSTGSWSEIQHTHSWTIQPPKYGISTPALVTDGVPAGITNISYKDDLGHTDKEMFVEEDGWGIGALHPYAGANQWVGETIDGSGIAVKSYNTYVDKDGIQFTPGTSIVDPNGNEMAFGGPYSIGGGGWSSSAPSTNLPTTDTLGRAWSYAGSTNVTGCPMGGPVNPTTSNIWTIPGPSNVNGGVRIFKLCYSTYNISSSFNNGFAVDYTGGTALLLTGLVLPDGTTWRFDYDKNLTTHYGDLTDIYTPTGGHFSYTWTTYTNDGCTTYSAGYRAVATRTVNDGVNSNQWKYSTLAQGKIIVTDPLGNDTVYQGNGCTGTISQIQYYSGSSTNGGALLKTVTKTYRDLPNPFISDTWADGTDAQLLATTTTAWANGQKSQSTLSYDSGFTFVDNNPDASPPNGQYTSSYGLVLSETHTDYGSGAPGPALSATNTNYKALTTPAYATANLLNLPISVIITDGSPTSPKVCAETDYNYDEYTLDSSGVTEQHVAAPNSVMGNQTSVTRQFFTSPCTSSAPPETPYKTVSHVYDTGMIHTTTDPLNNPPKTYSYSGTYFGAYPTSICDALNHCWTYTYDLNTGLMTSMEDPNNQTTNFQTNGVPNYDVMLRLLQANFPDGGETQFTYPNPTTVEVQRLISGSTWTNSYVYYDGLGREIRRASINDESVPDDQVDTCYEADGRIGFKTYPYQGSGGAPTAPFCSQPGDTFAYDPLNRPTQVTHSDGSIISTTYMNSSNQTTRATSVQDEGNGTTRVQRISQVDGLGRLTSVCEVSGSLTVGISGSQTAASCNLDIGGTGFLTTYTYNALGGLTSVAQGPLNPRSFTYDSLSRLTIATNPESGTICYGTYSGSTCQQNGYDADSNLIYKTDARNTVITYCYDALNRVTAKRYVFTSCPVSSPDVSYTYDLTQTPWGEPTPNSIGRLSWAVANSTAGCSGSVFGYDPVGRTATRATSGPMNCGVAAYVTTATYDQVGDTITLTNALNQILTYGYNRAQRVTSVSTSAAPPFNPGGSLFSSAHYNAAGSLTSATLGSGLGETRTYDGRLRLTGITVGPTGSPVYSLTIPSGSYAADSDILAADDSANGNWTYTYDAFNRLASANATGQAYTYVYDRFGNRWQQNGPHSSQPGFDANNHIVPGGGVTYDAAGDMTSDGTTTYTYDAENRIATAYNSNSGTSSYVYDPEGRRVQKTTVAGGTVDFAYDMEGHEITQFSSPAPGTWTREEIYVGGRHLATFANSATYYDHGDWLGTERARSSSNGTLYETCTSLPFGDWLTCGGSDPSPMHFTGKELDPESGSHYFGARYYTSGMGRFLTADPYNANIIKQRMIEGGIPEAAAESFFEGFLEDPQNINQYSYAKNNPLRLIDPTGSAPADGHHLIPDRGTMSSAGSLARDFANKIKTGPLSGNGYPNQPGFNTMHREYNEAVKEMLAKAEEAEGPSENWDVSKWKDFATRILNSDEPAIKNFLDELEESNPGAKVSLAAAISTYRVSLGLISRAVAAAAAELGQRILSNLIVCFTCQDETVTHRFIYRRETPN